MLAGATACDKPQASPAEKQPSASADEPAAVDAPAKFEPGVGSVRFESKMSDGPKIIALDKDGTVRIGERAVGIFAKNTLMLGGAEAGTLENGQYTLPSFDDAVFKLDDDGNMVGDDGEGIYLGWNEDGTVMGKITAESPEFTATVTGDPKVRDELTFLFMALTVAKGPALADEANLPKTGPKPDPAIESMLGRFHMAMIANDVDAMLAEVAFPIEVEGKPMTEAEFRPLAQKQAEQISKSVKAADDGAPSVNVTVLEGKVAQVYGGTAENVVALRVEYPASAAFPKMETVAMAVSRSDPPKLVAIKELRE